VNGEKMEIINEETTLVLRLSFKDENSVGVIPTAAQYRIDDVESGTQLLDWTSFAPSAITHDLTITDAQNDILDAALDSEKKKVTVKITYGPQNKKATADYIYTVKNLSKIT
jgi:ribose 5-phosphate isomerase